MVSDAVKKMREGGKAYLKKHPEAFGDGSNGSSSSGSTSFQKDKPVYDSSGKLVGIDTGTQSRLPTASEKLLYSKPTISRSSSRGGSYSPSTGVYTDPSGQKSSMAVAPAGATITGKIITPQGQLLTTESRQGLKPLSVEAYDPLTADKGSYRKGWRTGLSQAWTGFLAKETPEEKLMRAQTIGAPLGAFDKPTRWGNVVDAFAGVGKYKGEETIPEVFNTGFGMGQGTVITGVPTKTYGGLKEEEIIIKRGEIAGLSGGISKDVSAEFQDKADTRIEKTQDTIDDYSSRLQSKIDAGTMTVSEAKKLQDIKIKELNTKDKEFYGSLEEQYQKKYKEKWNVNVKGKAKKLALAESEFGELYGETDVQKGLRMAPSVIETGALVGASFIPGAQPAILGYMGASGLIKAASASQKKSEGYEISKMEQLDIGVRLGLGASGATKLVTGMGKSIGIGLSRSESFAQSLKASQISLKAEQTAKVKLWGQRKNLLEGMDRGAAKWGIPTEGTALEGTFKVEPLKGIGITEKVLTQKQLLSISDDLVAVGKFGDKSSALKSIEQFQISSRRVSTQLPSELKTMGGSLGDIPQTLKLDPLKYSSDIGKLSGKGYAISDISTVGDTTTGIGMTFSKTSQGRIVGKKIFTYRGDKEYGMIDVFDTARKSTRMTTKGGLTFKEEIFPMARLKETQIVKLKSLGTGKKGGVFWETAEQQVKLSHITPQRMSPLEFTERLSSPSGVTEETFGKGTKLYTEVVGKISKPLGGIKTRETSFEGVISEKGASGVISKKFSSTTEDIIMGFRKPVKYGTRDFLGVDIPFSSSGGGKGEIIKKIGGESEIIIKQTYGKISPIVSPTPAVKFPVSTVTRIETATVSPAITSKISPSIYAGTVVYEQTGGVMLGPSPVILGPSPVILGPSPVMPMEQKMLIESRVSTENYVIQKQPQAIKIKQVPVISTIMPSKTTIIPSIIPSVTPTISPPFTPAPSGFGLPPIIIPKPSLQLGKKGPTRKIKGIPTQFIGSSYAAKVFDIRGKEAKGSFGGMFTGLEIKPLTLKGEVRVRKKGTKPKNNNVKTNKKKTKKKKKR